MTGPRELAFFPGEACGTVYQPGGFRYDTEEIAHAARLKPIRGFYKLIIMAAATSKIRIFTSRM